MGVTTSMLIRMRELLRANAVIGTRCLNRKNLLFKFRRGARVAIYQQNRWVVKRATFCSHSLVRYCVFEPHFWNSNK